MNEQPPCFTAEQWTTVSQLDPELVAHAERHTFQVLGSLIIGQEVYIEGIESTGHESTLMTAIERARQGDKASERVVKNNVSTDVGERMFKVATQSKIELDATDIFAQEGRPLINIHLNTLRNTYLNPEMHDRTANQLSNSFMFNELLQSGILDTHDALVFEPCSDNEQTIRDYNFFADTASLSVQLLVAEGQKASLQTALVAGKKTAASPRHDLQAIHDLAEKKKVPLVPAEINGIVGFVMLLPKGVETPNTVEDVVAEIDEVLGGTFYGLDQPQQDYHQYAQDCYDRNRDFQDIVDKITQQLIVEADAFSSPLEAIQRLDYLSERYCVRRAKSDVRIDAMIFGAESAAHIEEARFYAAIGDEEKAEEALVMAQKTANSGSCPLFKRASESDDNDGEGGDSEKSESKWMKCPHCEAKVFADPCASYIACWDCKAKVIDGVSFKGNGGSKKRREEKQKKLLALKEAQAELTKV